MSGDGKEPGDGPIWKDDRVVKAAAVVVGAGIALSLFRGKKKDEVKDTAEDIADDAKDKANKLGDNVKQAGKDLKGNIKEATGDDLRHDLKKTGRDAKADAKQAGAHIKEDASRLAKDVKENAKEAGQNIKGKAQEVKAGADKQAARAKENVDHNAQKAKSFWKNSKADAEDNLRVATDKYARTHKILPGDTLWSLSRKYGVSVADIKRANGIGLDNKIEIGTQLRVPSTELGI